MTTGLPSLAALLLLSTAHASTPAPPSLAAGPEPGFKPVTSRSVAVNRIAETPEYVHPLGEDVNWLVLGVESRTRYEYRWNDYTTTDLLTDDALATRNLAYIGVRNVLDPLRLVVEFEDSRRFLSDRADNPSIENHVELLQTYVQLHFDDVFGNAPLSLSAGRMSFDSIDRRLIERTRNRNAMTAFDGIRLRLGDEVAPWEVDAFAMRHVEFNVEDLDHSSPNSTLYGLTAYLRELSPHLVLEPYWLWLDQREEGDPKLRKNLHTFGFHAFGLWGAHSAWDYDVSVAGQWGEVRGLDHRAGAVHVEAGHTWSTAWKPNLALWFNYATGDRHPNDSTDERFDSLYGDNFSFYSYSGYFAWQNIINPALRISVQPAKELKFEIIHRAIWLASSTDTWVRTDRRDPSGGSGQYVGQELDARMIWQYCRFADLDLAYGHLFPGGFADRTGRAPGSDFMQIAATVRF